MYKQAFTAGSLRFSSKSLRKSFPLKDLDLAIEQAEKATRQDKFRFGELRTRYINGKPVFELTKLSSKVVERKITDNIRRIYNVRQADRRLITSQVKALLEERVPFGLVRLDISAYFESIKKNNLIDKLDNDLALSFQTRRLIKQLLNKVELRNKAGLPRGLSVSTILAELYLKGFDRYIRSIEGVYYYARFVDDMIVFTVNDPNELFSKIANKLSSMDLMVNQSSDKKVIEWVDCKGCGRRDCRCKGEGRSENVSVDYLGYKYRFLDVIDRGARMRDRVKGGYTRVQVSMATGKLTRTKTRLAEALFAYAIGKDYELLLDRVRFLAGNYIVSRPGDVEALKAGIYFNYPLINDLECFRELDRIKVSFCYSSRSPLSKFPTGTISRHAARDICSISFVEAFLRKTVYSFSSKRLAQIRSCFSI